MKAVKIENELREVIARLITEVELSTQQGRLDINLISEDAWIPILREVFQCPNLINLNKKKKNFPGIDLGDEQERVAFQVTATSNLQKVKKTLSQFKEKNYKNSFDELYIFVITKKQSSYSQQVIDKLINDSFEFSVEKNIIDPGDILQKITSFRIGAQERLLNEFRVILGDIKDKNTTYESDNETPLLLVSNLARIEYPKHLYIAELDLDESFIIERARDQLDYKIKKGKKASKNLLVKLMLLMNGNNHHSWVTHENKLFTFSRLDIESEYNSVVDVGSSEKLDSDDFFNSDLIEYRNLFSSLLKNTVKDMLEPHRVNWHKTEKSFYFMPNNESDILRKESWIGKKKSTRTVYEKKYKSNDPEKVYYHKHLAFELSFINNEAHCYSVINPSWIYTFNAYRVSYYHKDLLSKQKRLEYNHSVRDQVRFLAYFLANLIPSDLPYLRFFDLIELECPYALPININESMVDSSEHTDEG